MKKVFWLMVASTLVTTTVGCTADVDKESTDEELVTSHADALQYCQNSCDCPLGTFCEPESGCLPDMFGPPLEFTPCFADCQCGVGSECDMFYGNLGACVDAPVSMTPPGPIPSVLVTCPVGYMPGYNQVILSAPTGVVESYVVERKSVKYFHFGWQQVYSGTSANPLINPQVQSYVRAKACNSGGCGPYTDSTTLASPSLYCP
jgi:hypothetical protein